MTQQDPIYVRPVDSKKMFGLSRSTIHKWAKQNKITIHKRSNMSFVEVAEVRRLIQPLGDQLGD